MNSAEIDALLLESLTDFQLTKSEKSRFNQWLATHQVDETELAFFRHRAFQIAKEKILDANVLPIMNWLEEVLKVLQKPVPRVSGNIESNAYFSPGDACIREIIRQIGICAASCDICVFTITDDRITRAILALHRKGVPVRILTDNDKSLDKGSDIEELIRAGIPVKMDQTPDHMHHKFAVFDRLRLLTGSFNWTRSATEFNEENLIVTNDSALVNPFQERFEQLWKRLETA